MNSSISKLPESSHETTEAFKKAAQKVNQELGLTFVHDTPTTTSETNKESNLKTILIESMTAQGCSPESIAQAEKFLDLRRDFIAEAIKLKNSSLAYMVPNISSEESSRHYKQAEKAVAEMLLLRKQSHQPSNTATEHKKPD